ncbi:MAG: flagellar basal body rod protein FlgB [Verrucomicrobiota bacterium]|nr:flagellar basal body rod protein FlgB [Verrucomicrobiota bacterium]
MINALFNQPNYQAARKMLDATVLRHEAIASNIANLETPNYKRLDVSTNFQSELSRAVANKDPNQIASLRPSIEVDPNAAAENKDGNSVQLENELLQLSQNSLTHTATTQMLTGTFLKLRMAITGRSV